MENATQALIMAGGILIAILIATIIIMLYGTFNNTTKGIVDTMDTTELAKYNSNFAEYVGRTDVTAQEIVSLIGLSQQREGIIKIFVNGTEAELWDTDDINKFLNENILVTVQDNSTAQHVENSFSYVNDSLKYDEYGRISEIRFRKN